MSEPHKFVAYKSPMDAKGYHRYAVYWGNAYVGDIFSYRRDHDSAATGWLVQDVHGVVHGWYGSIRNRADGAAVLWNESQRSS